MPRRPSCSSLLAALLTLGVCLPTAAGGQELAKVGETSIGMEAARKEFERVGATTPEARKAALDRMIEAELLHRAAVQAGYLDDPEVVAGLRTLVARRYAQDHLEPLLAATSVGRQEIEAYYAGHPAEFSTPAAARVAVVRIGVPPRAPGEKREQLRRRAEAAREEAERLPAATRSFGSVAVAYSDDQATRYQGGDAGWLTMQSLSERWPREIAAAALALAVPGQVGPVISAADGYYLVKLMDHRPEGALPLGAVEARIGQELLERKKQAIERDFFSRLADGVPVSVDERALAALPGPDREAPPGLPSTR
jgi:hypothetical protein